MHCKKDNLIFDNPFLKEFDATTNFTSRRSSPGSYLQYATLSTGYYYVTINHNGGDYGASANNTFTVEFTIPNNYSKCVLRANFYCGGAGSHTHSAYVDFLGKRIEVTGSGSRELTIQGPFVKGTKYSFTAYVSAWGKYGGAQYYTTTTQINQLQLIFYK